MQTWNGSLEKPHGIELEWKYAGTYAQNAWNLELKLIYNPEQKLLSLCYAVRDLAGFQPYQLAHKLDFERHEQLFLQIIYWSPSDGGVVVTLVKCQ